jgi:hypothetical protein
MEKKSGRRWNIFGWRIRYDEFELREKVEEALAALGG